MSHDNEICLLKRWAEDISLSLGDKFHLSLKEEIVLKEYNIYICTFNTKSELPSKIIKDTILKEADKYKDGRLYFMVYNNVESFMALQFYTFKKS